MSGNDLIFYTNPMSRGRVVRWMLEEIGCPYETKILDYGAEMKAPDYLAINPMGKVPAIRHGEAIVTETVAICTYLAEIFPEANLAPEKNDRAGRASYYRWLFFTAGPLEGAVTDKSMGFTVPQDKQMMAGYGNFEHMVRVLESEIEGREFIAGDRFSAADLVLGSYLSFYTYVGAIDRNPVFEEYAARHKSRPAAIRADRIDNALGEKTQG